MESSGEKIAFEASNGVTRPNNARECWGSQLKRVLGMKANTTCVRGRGWNIKERRQATTSSHQLHYMHMFMLLYGSNLLSHRECHEFESLNQTVKATQFKKCRDKNAELNFGSLMCHC